MIFVTGGTGILGSRLLFDLSRMGHEILATYRSESSRDFLQKVFQFYDPEKGQNYLKSIQWLKADIMDFEGIQDGLKHCDEIYHAAAKVSFHPKDEEEMFDVNVNGTKNLVNVSLELGIKKFCHVSSVASLGRDNVENHLDETALWKTSEFNSGYAKSKYAAEQEVWRAWEEGLPVVIVNPSLILGAGSGNSSSGTIFKAARNGLKYYTDGVVSYVDVRDVSSAMINLMDENIFGERFCLTTSSHSHLEILTWMATAMGNNPPKKQVGLQLVSLAQKVFWLKELITRQKTTITVDSVRGMFNKSYYSNEKIKAALGMEFISVEESVKTMAKFYVKHLN